MKWFLFVIGIIFLSSEAAEADTFCSNYLQNLFAATQSDSPLQQIKLVYTELIDTMGSHLDVQALRQMQKEDPLSLPKGLAQPSESLQNSFLELQRMATDRNMSSHQLRSGLVEVLRKRIAGNIKTDEAIDTKSKKRSPLILKFSRDTDLSTKSPGGQYIAATMKSPTQNRKTFKFPVNIVEIHSVKGPSIQYTFPEMDEIVSIALNEQGNLILSADGKVWRTKILDEHNQFVPSPVLEKWFGVSQRGASWSQKNELHHLEFSPDGQYLTGDLPPSMIMVFPLNSTTRETTKDVGGAIDLHFNHSLAPILGLYRPVDSNLGTQRLSQIIFDETGKKIKRQGIRVKGVPDGFRADFRFNSFVGRDPNTAHVILGKDNSLKVDGRPLIVKLDLKASSGSVIALKGDLSRNFPGAQFVSFTQLKDPNRVLLQLNHSDFSSKMTHYVVDLDSGDAREFLLTETLAETGVLSRLGIEDKSTDTLAFDSVEGTNLMWILNTDTHQFTVIDLTPDLP